MMEKKPEHRPRDAAMVGQVLEEIAEKVASQVSVGADVAAARAIDTRGLAAEDKAAARLLKAGSKKKKLRKKRIPIYRRGWFVALACLLLIGSFGAVFWKFALADPDPESLLAKIEAAKNAEARRDAVVEYLKYYEKRDDDATRRVKEMDREFKVKQLEHTLFVRYKRENLRNRPEEHHDADAYKKTMAALTAENEGDRALAWATWTELSERYSRDPDEAKAVWGWVAQKKLADMAAAERQLAGLLRRLEDDFRMKDEDARFEELDNRVVAAARFEAIGDFDYAHGRWKQIATNLEGSEESRPLFVLAKVRARDLEKKREQPKDAAERAKLIGDLIARAKSLLAMNIPARHVDGRNLLREVRDLYAGETGDIGRLVDEAKRLLDATR
jgi:serine/threonine-protein kinase